MDGYAFYHLIKSNVAQYKLDLLDNGLAVLTVHFEYDRNSNSTMLNWTFEKYCTTISLKLNNIMLIFIHKNCKNVFTISKFCYDHSFKNSYTYNTMRFQDQRIILELLWPQNMTICISSQNMMILKYSYEICVEERILFINLIYISKNLFLQKYFKFP